MSRMPRAKSISEIYHIIIRGTGQQILFESKSDGQFFLNMLKKYAREADIVLYGYCLMDNHVHLLLQGKQPMLSDFMKRLCGNYASYFNNKYDRVGTLFQSRFRSEPIEDDRYFLTVLRYIIMNPERAGVCQRDRYGWSCYKEYFLQPAICDTSFASRICGSEDALQQFLRSEPQDSAVLKPKGRVSFQWQSGCYADTALTFYARLSTKVSLIKNSFYICTQQTQSLTKRIEMNEAH